MQALQVQLLVLARRNKNAAFPFKTAWMIGCSNLLVHVIVSRNNNLATTLVTSDPSLLRYLTGTALPDFVCFTTSFYKLPNLCVIFSLCLMAPLSLEICGGQRFVTSGPEVLIWSRTQMCSRTSRRHIYRQWSPI